MISNIVYNYITFYIDDKLGSKEENKYEYCE